jgi:hypothetical protein
MPPTTTGAARGTHAQRTGKPKAAAYTPPGQLDAELAGQQRARREEGRSRVERRRSEPPAGDDTTTTNTDASSSSGGRSLPSLPDLSGGGGALQTGSGIVLGIVGYAVLLNWIRGGPSQVKGWILAKLINRPYDNRKVGTS